MANNLQKGSAGPMRLYVGSLHFNITEDMLRGIFEPFGRVSLNLFSGSLVVLKPIKLHNNFFISFCHISIRLILGWRRVVL